MKKFLYFLGSGGFCTLLDTLLFSLLILVVNSSVAYLTSYLCCIFVRFFIDRQLIGSTKETSLKTFFHYFLSNVIAMLCGLMAFHFFLLYLPTMISKILSIPLTLISGFLMVNFYVFSKKLPNVH